MARLKLTFEVLDHHFSKFEQFKVIEQFWEEGVLKNTNQNSQKIYLQTYHCQSVLVTKVTEEQSPHNDTT